MSNIYESVKNTLDAHLDSLARDVFESPDSDAYARWLESLVQSLLVEIRPEPTADAFEGYGNEYAEMGRVRRIVAGSLVQLQSIRENWQIEQRVSARPNQNLRAADDIDHMVNALTFCRWLLAPWRRTDDAGRS